MRISDWSSDVCSSDLPKKPVAGVETIEINLTSDDDVATAMAEVRQRVGNRIASVIHLAAYYDTTGEENPKYDAVTVQGTRRLLDQLKMRSEEHTSELQSLMRISYAVFCLKKKN